MNPIVQWVLRTMMKGQTGVVRALPKKELLDLNVNITVERLIRNGIDPSAIKTPDQVDNIIKQIEAPRNVQQGITSTKSAKIMDMEGKQIDPRSKIMGGKQAETEAEIAARINRENKKSVGNIKNKMTEIDEAIDNASPGFAGDRKYDAQLVADDLAEKRFGKDFYDLDQKQQLDLYDEALEGLAEQKRGMPDPEDMADGGVAGLLGERPGYQDGNGVADEDAEKAALGKRVRQLMDDGFDFGEAVKQAMSEGYAEGGRIGLKAGMNRRAFLKLMGGVGAGIGALKTGILKLAGKGAASQAAKEIITTPAAAGKPAWFDALVTKVINQGEDVTKQFATKDREIVHATKIDDDAMVTVYRDLDDGTVRVDVSDATKNVMDEQGDSIVSMEVRGGQIEEGVKGKTPAEFEAVETDYRNYATDPDGGYETESVENVVNNTKDLTADLTKLKIYARGDNKPTMKEFVESKKRKTKLDQASENPASYAADRGPDFDYNDVVEDLSDDFAKGGLAGMLGE